MRNAIRRFFFNENVFSGSVLIEAALIIATLICARLASSLSLYTIFEILVRSLLIMGLYRAYKKQNIFIMSGLVAGLLFCILYREANLVLGDLLSFSVDKYIMMGFKGSLYLCISMSILFLECIMVYNHFSVSVRHINGITKLVVNELATLMLFIMLIVQIFSNIFLDLNLLLRAYYVLATLAEGVLFVITSHCDLIMALDRGDENE